MLGDGWMDMACLFVRLFVRSWSAASWKGTLPFFLFFFFFFFFFAREGWHDTRREMGWVREEQLERWRSDLILRVVDWGSGCGGALNPPPLGIQSR